MRDYHNRLPLAVLVGFLEDLLLSSHGFDSAAAEDVLGVAKVQR